MCDCIQQTNNMLKEHNVRLVSTMFSKPEVVVVETAKIDTKKRGRPPVMLASFCPFCGEEYTYKSEAA